MISRIILCAVCLVHGPIPRAADYHREHWRHWTDADGDCQDTRSEILQRDNIGEIEWGGGRQCDVVRGKWVCPYTGKVFTRASDLDIDHVVPLAHAHRTGGADWSREQKQEFANDPLNLLAVDDGTNQEKGSQSPDEWQPPAKEYRQRYYEKWRAVKKKYGLSLIQPRRRGGNR